MPKYALTTMNGQFRKLDPQKVVKLKRQGLSNSQIAQRLGVSQGAVYQSLRKLEWREMSSGATPTPAMD